MSCYSECFKNPTWRDVLVLENTSYAHRLKRTTHDSPKTKKMSMRPILGLMEMSKLLGVLKNDNERYSYTM
jgi:hypothetical protein